LKKPAPERKKKLPLSATARLRIQGLESEAQCIELRNQGMKYAQIGAAVGLSIEGVRLALLRGMKKFADEDVTKNVRLALLEKYDLLAEKYLPAALDGEEKAFERFMRIAEAMAKVGGCLQELPQGIGGPAVAFNYYMPVAEKNDIIHVDPDDYNLPRPELGSGINTNGNGVAE